MANLPVKFSADTKPLESAFTKIADRAKELGKQFQEVGTDLGKGLTGFDMTKALGIGGAVYAAGKLGEALIDAAKEGYKAFQDYQDAVLRFKYNLPTSLGSPEERGKIGAEVAEHSSKSAGVFTEEQLNAASLSLMQASKELRESPEKLYEMLDTIQALAIKTNRAPEEISESMRRLFVGMKEEGGAAVGKFFKATPGLEDETEKLRDAHAQDYLKRQGVNEGTASNAQLAEFARLSKMEIGEFMTQETGRVGGEAVLEEIKGIMERSAPKSIIKEEEGIHPEKMLAAAFEEFRQAFGKELMPAVNTMVTDIRNAVPALRESFVEIADVLQQAVIPAFHVLGTIMEAFGNFMVVMGTALEKSLEKIIPFSKTTDFSKDADARLVAMGIDPNGPMTRGDYKPTPEEQLKNYRPYGDEHKALEMTKVEAAGSFEIGSDEQKEARKKAKEAAKEAAKAEEEAAKLEIKNIHAHSEAVAQRHLEATQSDLEHKVRVASRAALATINPNDKSLAGQESAETTRGNVKQFELKESSAAKIRALDEESALKQAKIKEEMEVRAIARVGENAKDDTDDKRNARAAVRLTEDNASAQQIADIQDETAQKIRDENASANDKIIDSQIETAKTISDTIRSVYEGLIARHEGPYKFTPDEGPPEEETYSKFGKGGSVIEGSFERKRREKANREGQKATDDANDAWLRAAEDAALNSARKPGHGGVGSTPPGTPEAQHIAVNVGYDKDGGQHTSFDFGKGVTAAVKTNVILGEILKSVEAMGMG